MMTRWIEVVDEDIVWRFDAGFFGGRWQCIWGGGCQGILDRLAPELEQGCCSEGAALVDDDDAMNVAANAAALTAEQWQHQTDTPLERRGDGRWFTKVVDDACVFFNRPGFEGGVGCALHIAAVAYDERPIDWKPNVCWQMPMRVEVEGNVRSVRPWSRKDWGPEAELAWFCTEPNSGAFGGKDRVVDTLKEEIIEMVGVDVYEALAKSLSWKVWLREFR